MELTDEEEQEKITQIYQKWKFDEVNEVKQKMEKRDKTTTFNETKDPNKIDFDTLKDDVDYYVEVITDEYPSILEKGMKYIIRGQDFPNYLSKLDIKFITMEEYNKWIEESKRTDTDDAFAFDGEKPKIQHPKTGRSVSKFVEELSEIIKDKNILFFRPDSKKIVEVGEIHEEDKTIYTEFIDIEPRRFITLIEKYMVPGVETENKRTDEWEFEEKSIFAETSKITISSHIFQQALPHIKRLFTIPIPILYKGMLTFPKKGYDSRFASWLPYNTPGISQPLMTLQQAKEVIEKIFKEFCFQSEQDKMLEQKEIQKDISNSSTNKKTPKTTINQNKTNAIAALITPFLRGLFSEFNVRTPVSFYLGNRERIGKDYCAGVTGIVYEGYPLEEAAISSADTNRSSSSEELAKRFLATLRAGRKRMHFSNNKGYINNVTFEAMTTATKWTGRLLGKNEELAFDNEVDFSLSGNAGVRYTPDLSNRCIFINLFYAGEHVNERAFKNPKLHKWISNNRSLILSALYALVRNWIGKKSPKGTKLFASFPEWAEICGGILEAASYGNPCEITKENRGVGGDVESEEMKDFFELCFETCPNTWLTKNDMREIIQSDKNIEVFKYYDFTLKADKVKFGIKIPKFVGREFSDIKMIVQDATIKPRNQLFKFINIHNKNEQVGQDGQVDPNSSIEDK